MLLLLLLDGKHKLDRKWGHIVSYVAHQYSRVDFYSSWKSTWVCTMVVWFTTNHIGQLHLNPLHPCNLQQIFHRGSMILNSSAFWVTLLKETLDKYNIIPPTFSKKVVIFIPLEVLAWVTTACWISCSRLFYCWRNMSISSIFYFQRRLQ